MEQFLPLLECPVCYIPFNNTDHVPYVLVCGHNICQNAINHLYRSNQIKCPKCRKENTYENIKDISKNFMALDMIKTFQKTAFINFPNNPFSSALTKIPEVIQYIQEENYKITEFFKCIRDYEQRILKFNDQLIKTLEAYRILQEQQQQAFQISVHLENDEPSQLLKKKQGELKNIKKRIEKEIQQIAAAAFTVNGNIKKDIIFKGSVKIFQKKQRSLDKIEDIDVIRDYAKLTQKIHEQIDIYQHWEKNYKITKNNNSDNILEILYAKDRENLEKDNAQASVVLGFLHYHGILVEKNKLKAKEYYEKAANAGNPQGCFLLYWFDTDKIDFLFKSLDKNFYPNALNALGFEFRFQDLIKQKLKLLLYQLAAHKGSTFGKFNTGIQYEDGKVTCKDLDLAAHWYKEALDDGYLEAKEQLDMVYDETYEFKRKHPHYQKWNKSYEKFYNQRIVLL